MTVHELEKVARRIDPKKTWSELCAEIKEDGPHPMKEIEAYQPWLDIESKGYFVPPTIFGRVNSQTIIAQQEIFGPVLACNPAKNFDEALEIADGTEFHTGNLYFNLKLTDALMGVHPFGALICLAQIQRLVVPTIFSNLCRVNR